MSKPSASIDQMRVYAASRQLEDSIYELVKSLPESEYFRLGNDLRRSSAAISHYLTECHKRYSYSIKLEALHLARTESEMLKRLLLDFKEQGFGDTEAYQAACNGITKQTWGFIRYLKARQTEQRVANEAEASDQLVAARA